MGGVFAQDQKAGSAAVAVRSPPSNPVATNFRLSVVIGFLGRRNFHIGA